MKTKDRVYEFIVQYTKEHLYPPTFSEIGVGVQLGSKSSVYHYIHSLVNDGRIEIGDCAQPRSIKLVGYQLVKVGEESFEKFKGTL